MTKIERASAVLVEYVESLAPSSDNFKLEKYGEGDPIDMIDNDPATGMKTFDHGGEHWLRIRLHETDSVPVGSVLVFTDPLMSDGDLKFYIHNDEGDMGGVRHALLEATAEENCGGFVNVGDSAPVYG